MKFKTINAETVRIKFIRANVFRHIEPSAECHRNLFKRLNLVLNCMLTTTNVHVRIRFVFLRKETTDIIFCKWAP